MDVFQAIFGINDQERKGLSNWWFCPSGENWIAAAAAAAAATGDGAKRLSPAARDELRRRMRPPRGADALHNSRRSTHWPPPWGSRSRLGRESTRRPGAGRRRRGGMAARGAEPGQGLGARREPATAGPSRARPSLCPPRCRAWWSGVRVSPEPAVGPVGISGPQRPARISFPGAGPAPGARLARGSLRWAWFGWPGGGH